MYPIAQHTIDRGVFIVILGALGKSPEQGEYSQQVERTQLPSLDSEVDLTCRERYAPKSVNDYRSGIVAPIFKAATSQ